MKTPENLLKAVEHLNPQAILLLDTNTVMDYPQFVSHKIAAPGPFLLVVPQVVDNELLGLTFNNDTQTKQKASRAHKQLGKLYERGNPADGIDVGNDRWVMTVSSPRPAATENTPIEEDQIWRYLGQVDAALLRLADACAEDLPDTRTLLITRDRKLTHVARSRGLAVYPWPKLRSPETLDRLLLPGDRFGPITDIDTYFSSLLDSNKERNVKMAMTLEELKSEGDYLVARGMGCLNYDDEEYRFRWTYPYEDAGKTEDTDSLIKMMDNLGTMPLENVDFFGKEESLQEDLKRYVCSVLVEAGRDRHASDPTIWHDFPNVGEIEYRRESLEHDDPGWKGLWERGRWSLQSPSVRLRLAVIYMECLLWGYTQLLDPEGMDDVLQGKSSEEAESVKELIVQYWQAIRHLIDCVPPTGPLKDDLDRLKKERRIVDEARESFKREERAHLEKKEKGGFDDQKALQESERALKESELALIRKAIGGSLELAEYQVSTGYAYLVGTAYLDSYQAYKELAERLGLPATSIETGLAWLLDVASDSWAVGQTREWESSYFPFVLPDEAE